MSIVPPPAQTDEEIVRDVIAMERGALERWGKGDPSGFLEICAKDVVYFDPYLENRLDGKEALTRYYENIRGKVKIVRFEVRNPHVHVMEDCAVLTFNFDSVGPREDEAKWNCTEVYRRDVEGWRIVQTHWSFTARVLARGS